MPTYTVSTATNRLTPRNAVWAYLAELPPSQMAEFGHLLPEPGTEAGWFQSLPPEDRDLMERIGR